MIIASGSDNGIINIWDINTKKCINTINTNHKMVKYLSFSTNGTKLASVCDNCINIWDCTSANGQLIDALKDTHCNYIKFIDNDQKILYCDNANIKIWNFKDENNIIITDNFAFPCFHVSSDEHLLVYANSNKEIKILDIVANKLIQLFNDEELHAHVSFSKDNQKIVSSDINGNIKIWDINTAQPICAISSDGKWMTKAGFSDDDNKIVSGGYCNNICIWNANNGELLKRMECDDCMTVNLSFLDNDQKIISIQNGVSESVYIWDVESGQLENHIKWLAGETNACMCADFYPKYMK